MNGFPSLTETVTGGINGTRIYTCSNGIHYAVDGEIDCRLPDAEAEIMDRAWRHDVDIMRLRGDVLHDKGMFNKYTGEYTRRS